MSLDDERIALMVGAIEERYNDWYNSREELQTVLLNADWSDRDDYETLSHAIVRNDIPWLLETVTACLSKRASDPETIPEMFPGTLAALNALTIRKATP